MSKPVSSMDVEDVLSSIRRLVSEEAKGMQPLGDTKASSKSDLDLVKADEGAVASKEWMPWDETDTPAEDSAVAEVASDDIVEQKNEAPLGDRLVLTADFMVNAPLPKTDDAVAAEETPEPPVRERGEKPHLRAVENFEPPLSRKVVHEPVEELTSEPEIEAKEAAQKGRRKRINFMPDETLHERAAQEHATGESVEEVAEVEVEEVAVVEAAPVEEAPVVEEAAVEVAAAPAPAEELVVADEVGVDALEDSDLADYEAILDDVSLREIVGEMVREELQGELGDRITRNVRKLVRREIQRALVSQELD